MTKDKQSNIFSKEALIDTFRKGQKLKYIFFWGHQPHPDGQISKSCFSQWWASDFTIDNITYPTAEHYMMAEKARLFNDSEMLKQILASSHPGEAKKYGRQVHNFDNAIWQAHRFDIVVQGNLAKFSQNEALKTFLLQSQNRVLVEASPRDSIWGIGLAEDAPHAQNPEKWAGLNLLGFALMKVRSQLNSGAKI